MKISNLLTFTGLNFILVFLRIHQIISWNILVAYYGVIIGGIGITFLLKIRQSIANNFENPFKYMIPVGVLVFYIFCLLSSLKLQEKQTLVANDTSLNLPTGTYIGLTLNDTKVSYKNLVQPANYHLKIKIKDSGSNNLPEIRLYSHNRQWKYILKGTWIAFKLINVSEHSKYEAYIANEAPIIIHEPAGISAWINNLRSKFINFNNDFFPPAEASLISGMIIGNTVDFSSQQYISFKNSGLIHLVAVSGGNIVILIFLVVKVLEYVGVYPKIKYLVVLVFLLLFINLVRAEPSVIRASFMACLALSTQLINRRQPPLRIFSYAVCGIILINPSLVIDLGFQLSVFATVSILGLATSLKRIFSYWLGSGLLTDYISVSVAAVVGTVPVLFNLNNNFNIGVIWANVLASFLVPFITIVGSIIFVLVNLFPGLASIFGFIIYFPLKLLNALAASIANWWQYSREYNLLFFVVIVFLITINNVIKRKQFREIGEH